MPSNVIGNDPARTRNVTIVAKSSGNSLSPNFSATEDSLGSVTYTPEDLSFLKYISMMFA